MSGYNRIQIKCPKCGSEQVIPTFVGVPGPEDIERSREGKLYLLGKCAYLNDPDYHCNSCGYDFWNSGVEEWEKKLHDSKEDVAE